MLVCLSEFSSESLGMNLDLTLALCYSTSTFFVESIILTHYVFGYYKLLLTTNQASPSVYQLYLTWSRANLSSADCCVPANTRSLLESCILRSLIYNPKQHITSNFSILKFKKKEKNIKKNFSCLLTYPGSWFESSSCLFELIFIELL